MITKFFIFLYHTTAKLVIFINVDKEHDQQEVSLFHTTENEHLFCLEQDTGH